MPNIKRDGPGTSAHLPGHAPLEASTVTLDGTDTDESRETDQDCSIDNTDHVYSTDHTFMYLNVLIGCQPITALLDSGSSINIVSKSLYELLPHSVLSCFANFTERVLVANNGSVKIFGTVNMRMRYTESGKPYTIHTYILDEASHPMIKYNIPKSPWYNTQFC